MAAGFLAVAEKLSAAARLKKISEARRAFIVIVSVKRDREIHMTTKT
jgi:hypothetical protein